MHTSPTPQDFLDRSLQLLQARPATTRTITTYHSPSPRQLRKQALRKSKTASTTATSTTTTTTTTPQQQPGTLTLKTYDPVSGAVIVFSTTRSADVARLVGALARVGRGMAGVKEKEGAAGGAGDAMEGVEVAEDKPAEKAVEKASEKVLPVEKGGAGAGAGGAGGKTGKGGKGKKGRK